MFQQTHLITVSKTLMDDEFFPVHIESLALETMECGDDDQTWTELHKTTAKRCQDITDLTLYQGVDFDKAASYADLKASFSFKLTQLKIQNYLPLQYTAQELEDLACSLPSLEILELAPNPSNLGSLGTFSLDHLLLFAQHCPKLVRFGTWIGAARYCVAPPNSVPFLALQELDVGKSPLESCGVDDVAIFLAQILPWTCEMKWEGWKIDKKGGDNWKALRLLLSGLRTVMQVADRRARAELSAEAR
ncbi:hypothetical protein C0995_013149 [Termitomyces sp. Mi166|nr:hypothetical protein C0995_013149 [Termitomyces sp. Mi166\